MQERCENYDEILENIEEVLKKQRGKKFDAISHAQSAYLKLVEDNKDGIKYWAIAEHVRCKVCKSKLLYRVSPLGLYTIDGERIYHCITCDSHKKRDEILCIRSH